MHLQNFLDEILLTPRGKGELSKLQATHVRMLWQYAFSHMDLPESDDNDGDYQRGRNIMERLLDVVPETVNLNVGIETKKNYHCWVHRALDRAEHLPPFLLQRIIEASSMDILEGKSTYDRSKCTSLLQYALCKHHTSLNVIRQIYNKYPEVIHRRDTHSQLPLHTFIHSMNPIITQETLDKLKFLLSVDHCFGHLKQGRYGLPFHSFCIHTEKSARQNQKLLLEFAQTLYKKYARALREKMPQERVIPLLYECQNANIYNVGLILFLLERFPNGALEEDRAKLTPFQLIKDETVTQAFLTEARGSAKAITALLRARGKSKNDNILHAFAHKGPFVISDTADSFGLRLISLLPPLVLELNNDGELPIHALLNGSCKDGQELLLYVQELISAQQKIKDNTGEDVISSMHGGLFPFMMAASRKYPCLTTTFVLLQYFVGANGGLCTCA